MNRLVVCAFALALVACQDSVAVGPDGQQSQTDTYTLTEISGMGLPAHIPDGNQTEYITAGSLLLNADMTYSVMQTSYTSQIVGGVTVNSDTTTGTIESGTYNVTGTKIVFTVPARLPGDTTYTHQGSISGSYLNYTDASGLAYVYELPLSF
jgi:hypothetical protein